jgi:hypothetical protein
MSLFLLSSFCCGGLLRYKKGSWEAVHLLPIWQHWPQKRPAKIWNRIWTDPQLNDLLDRVRKTGLQITKNKKVIKLDFNDMLTLKKLFLRTWCRHAVGFPFRAYRFSLYRSQIDPPPPFRFYLTCRFQSRTEKPKHEIFIAEFFFKIIQACKGTVLGKWIRNRAWNKIGISLLFTITCS